MKKLVENIQSFFEKQAFGVCSWWGNKLGINSGSIRIYFIYLSFLTFGSPIVLYLIMAFILQVRSRFRFRKPSIWEF
ncbi:MAG: PspC domain-containing protein [Bacteroidetes bacterium]|jgi:phage shock protein PspC (stress-responsive transcriptional regulator)|nr:PspC domain-containing protein [Bacteroidota bacterium]NOG95083.1 PspC domain-containing protein [Bacteroidota bacterium]WKZ74470.1 MAG: PspC domain-containing protein [Vicingaceae bacterium]